MVLWFCDLSLWHNLCIIEWWTLQFYVHLLCHTFTYKCSLRIPHAKKLTAWEKQNTNLTTYFYFFYLLIDGCINTSKIIWIYFLKWNICIVLKAPFVVDVPLYIFRKLGNVPWLNPWHAWMYGNYYHFIEIYKIEYNFYGPISSSEVSFTVVFFY